MAITLAEASKLSNDALLVGIIENVIKDSAVLQTMPFVEIVGNGLTYNREKTLPTVGWYDPNDPWNARMPTSITSTNLPAPISRTSQEWWWRQRPSP